MEIFVLFQNSFARNEACGHSLNVLEWKEFCGELGKISEKRDPVNVPGKMMEDRNSVDVPRNVKFLRPIPSG